jgi:hypothetical protein
MIPDDAWHHDAKGGVVEESGPVVPSGLHVSPSSRWSTVVVALHLEIVAGFPNRREAAGVDRQIDRGDILSRAGRRTGGEKPLRPFLLSCKSRQDGGLDVREPHRLVAQHDNPELCLQLRDGITSSAGRVTPLA